MTIAELQQKIRALKAEKDVYILAHSYQAPEILEVADFCGDSYALSVAATKTSAQTVVLCGVRFMAETAKLLSPDKTVLLANPLAGCPMAEQMDPAFLAGVKAQYPNHTVVAYINTTAALKTLCDVCVTSSSAVEIVRKLPGENILFIPDCNLGDYVSKQVPEKSFKLLKGGCPVHAAVCMADVLAARAAHPQALLLVHPECLPEVVSAADYVGSTSGIMATAKQSGAKEFIIGTEMSIAGHLQMMCPDKRFYPLSHKLICPDMKLTTLTDVVLALSGEAGEEIVLPDELMRDARRCIDEMIRLGEA